ncbi:MarR family transcriptional regulator [Modestobacter sp. I12A-02628]|uniref:Winged helix-turn-helix transcriptional regulator n=1 Tax=Goekera deserti TaxID=2497753 RepID=A0A7K3WFS0_9ACTN|nr:MarR family transcriptional regulator [Goekera deserti]NDI46486.1 MarR family transcriptional regulator [Goekera deserti]NEL54580.1 winged helix-turn-helix transcriptional regulator [Goekera deserti]
MSAGGPADSPGFLLWHATLRWQRQITAALAPLGLTHVQFVLLACAWWLGRRGDQPNQQRLARQAGVDVRMASQVIRTLEGKGLLERQVDPADTRARRLRLTPAGVTLAARAVSVVEQVDGGVFGEAAQDLLSALSRMPATSGAGRHAPEVADGTAAARPPRPAAPPRNMCRA